MSSQREDRDVLSAGSVSESHSASPALTPSVSGPAAPESSLSLSVLRKSLMPGRKLSYRARCPVCTTGAIRSARVWLKSCRQGLCFLLHLRWGPSTSMTQTGSLWENRGGRERMGTIRTYTHHCRGCKPRRPLWKTICHYTLCWKHPYPLAQCFHSRVHNLQK